MKYFFLGLSLILFASCKKVPRVDFTGNIPDIKSGTFVVKNLADSTLYGVNIKDGKFQTGGILAEAGYYTMDIIDDADKGSHDKHYEIYLEDGSYTITKEAGKHYDYPKITSSSKIQNDLSAYYTLIDQLSGAANEQIYALSAKQDKTMKSSSKKEFNSLTNQISAAEDKQTGAGFIALKQFVKQYPQSIIPAHLMYKMPYDTQPLKYEDVYKDFSPEAKNTDEGKDLGEKLDNLVKLLPGAISPAIVGNTPEGKPFDRSVIKKKVILIDFWRSVNQVSRLNHQQMQDMLQNLKGLGIVSISIDSKDDWWKTAIKEDKITWPQVSDLKGDDSQNATHWAITQIPTYYLVDGNWKIIARDIQISEVPVYMNEYLSKH